MVQCTILTANVTLVLLFSWAFYYVRNNYKIDDDLIELFYTSEKCIYYTCTGPNLYILQLLIC